MAGLIAFLHFYCHLVATTCIDIDHSDCEVGITPRPGLAAFFYCGVAATTCIDLTSGAGRKSLRRCPDLSLVPRDGIVVIALSFLPSPLIEENRLLRSAPLDREDRRLRHARRHRRHVRGVTESLPSERRTNVVPSRRGEAAVQTVRDAA